ncbi:hypothetical protein TSUD_139480 [Trifolium subterraneum]|uniref:Peptidase A1 domain-containing protein n=1 Tax=Trifolium subterraneum TaxID=3900 RepID=A0A2Z6P8J4_TRISU|nr:hypothetical protein TSUD_139480 [Trifolium subterraneum]
MAYPYILFILSLLLTFSSSTPNPNTITLPLSPLFPKSQSSNLFHSLKTLASSSLSRAHHLKTQNSNHKSSSITNTQIFSKSYGGYSINLNFGTPSQTLSFVLDTGATTGFLLLENLNFPGKTVPDFLVGCSILSTQVPAGIVGFGRDNDSLPSQIGLKRFSYCLLSHQFDDSPENSYLVLQVTSTGDTKTKGLSYTPFRKNLSTNNTSFLQYYYVNLRSVVIGGKHVKIPLTVSEPGIDGNGGTIVDSGSTFTFMEKEIFDLVVEEFEKQLANFTRAKEIEGSSGLSLCFNFTGVKTVPFPEVVFQFKGGWSFRCMVVIMRRGAMFVMI